MSYVRVNTAKLQATLQALSDETAKRAAYAYREKLREEIALSGRVDTGEMMDRIKVERGVPTPQRAVWRVIPETKQFRFQDRGTRGSVAKKGHVLRFKPKGSSTFVFAKKTGPITAANFLAKAKARMSKRDFEK